MSRKRQLITMLLVAGAVVAVAGGVTWATVGAGHPGCPHTGNPAENSHSVSHVVTEDPTAVSDYWTPERMKSARPVPMPAPPTDDCW